MTEDHPLAEPLRALLERVAADPLLTGAGAPPGARVRVRRDLRVELPADAGAVARGAGGEIARFIWCAYWRDADPPHAFHARTLLHDRGRGDRTFDFPDDPLLPAAGAPGSPLKAPGVEVLRYVPRQRITFRAGDLVGKIKRPPSVPRSYARLEAAFAAARRGGARFAVPEPRGIDAERGVFYQAHMRGRPVDDLLDEGNAERLLRALGALHRELHELAVEGVPARDPEEALAEARADAAWVAFAAPEHAAAVADLDVWLAGELASAHDGEPGFCHGDLAIDQVLLEGDAYAIVDFDDAALGDPLADVGTMLAALPLDAPHVFDGRPSLVERALAAYLEGYCERAGGALDERRLRAHHVRADLAQLASRLRKGLADPAEVADAVGRLRARAAGG